MTKLALIGAGRWGKNLARVFHALGALHTICDPSKELLVKYQEQYEGVAVTTDFAGVVANNEIERVVIAAPAALHYKLAKQALLAGKDVYVEKPLCLKSAEGEELVALAEEEGRILMVGHLLHYHPYVEKLKSMVGQGELGQIQYIVSNRLNLGTIRTEENALWSFAPHDLSIILALCGGVLPEKVQCTGGAYLTDGVADTTLTSLQFSGNVRAHVYVSWLNPFKEQKLIVTGSKGLLVFDDRLPWEEKLKLYRNPVTWKSGSIPQANKAEAESIVVAQGEPLKSECQHFIECCDKRCAPKTDGKEGLRVLKVLESAQASLIADGEGQDPRGEEKSYFAHSSAVIDEGAAIGTGTKIWHFSHIMKTAKVGPECNIGQNVVVSPDVVLGRNVKVQNNVSIYTGVICEDDVFLGPSMVFTNVNNPRSSVNRRGEYEQTLLRKGATVGANATIVCGTELGEYSFIGAGAVVTKDVKPFALMVGNPAKHVGWMSRDGERLDLPPSLPIGEEKEATCPATGEIYCLEGESLMLKEKTLAGV